MKSHTFKINSDVVINVQVFEQSQDSKWNDICIFDYSPEMIDQDFFKNAAKNLIDSFEDSWCPFLLEAIKEECNNRLNNK